MLFCIWTDRGYILGFDSTFGTTNYGYGDDVKYYDEETANRIADRLRPLHDKEYEFVAVIGKEEANMMGTVRHWSENV